jgi:predicted lipoprotein with Yx(FWY)xxD motif
VKKIALVTAVLVAVAAAVAAPASPMKKKPAPAAPAIKLNTSGFGPILATRGRQALYFWTEERDFKIHCVGECLALWPPLIVKKASAVPKRVAGVRGVFGTIRRPDGRLQVTHDRLPVYTYAHEGPNQVLCDNSGGWFVVRV